MSVRKTAGFLSPKQISELVWDSESEEAGALSICIIYLGNRTAEISLFNYSFLEGVRKYHAEILDSPS
jgi:hypothetical protein